MFDPKTVSLGIAPIGWCNDDMPELGAENTFQQTVSEMALAGFTGCEIGNKYPTDPAELKKALDLRADVLRVSQTVTQKDVHIQNLTNLIELLEAEGLRDKFVVCCGGPRITHELAKELGYDAGFGAGKYADDVASFAVTEMVKRGMK